MSEKLILDKIYEINDPEFKETTTETAASRTREELIKQLKLPEHTGLIAAGLELLKQRQEAA